MNAGFNVERKHVNGIAFEIFTAGEGDRLALCLHGFPEHALSWRWQIPVLAGLGYHVWAPNQRGYGNTSPRPPAVEFYAIENLLDDVEGLITASKAKSVTLIAHDWGAAIAWYFALRRQRQLIAGEQPAIPLERLVIMNVPHPALFSEALNKSLRQKLRSWYMVLFQIRAVPEWLLGLDWASPIARLFTATACEPERFTPDILAVYVDQARVPGALTGMVNWYRAAGIGGGNQRQIDLGFPSITVPTLMLWGEEDIALLKDTTYGTHRYVKDLQLHYLPGASHWVQQDAPERVNEELVRFLR